MLRNVKMTELVAALETVTARLSELGDTELDALIADLERGLIHALVESNLRGAPQPPTTLRSV